MARLRVERWRTAVCDCNAVQLACCEMVWYEIASCVLREFALRVARLRFEIVCCEIELCVLQDCVPGNGELRYVAATHCNSLQHTCWLHLGGDAIAKHAAVCQQHLPLQKKRPMCAEKESYKCVNEVCLLIPQADCFLGILQHTATHCNTLQLTATYCNTATHYWVLRLIVSWLTSVDGYCSTVQGLLDWFEVDLGFTELSFIHSIHSLFATLYLGALRVGRWRAAACQKTPTFVKERNLYVWENSPVEMMYEKGVYKMARWGMSQDTYMYEEKRPICMKIRDLYAWK